jgi:hypothetical protein
MSEDLVRAAERRRGLLAAEAGGFAATAVENLRREFPYHLRHLMLRPGDFPHTPRDIHPAFCTSFDWHSCVEMHWVLVRRRIWPSRPPPSAPGSARPGRTGGAGRSRWPTSWPGGTTRTAGAGRPR